jgi:hypothetical protein
MSFMDTAQLLGNLGEFIGAIVIVATLIYLALQVRQNSEELAAQSRYNYYRGRSELGLVIAQNKDLADILTRRLSGDEISTSETIRIGYLVQALLAIWEYEFGEFASGRLSEDEFNPAAKRKVFERGTGTLRTVWAEYKITAPQRFVAYIDENVAVQSTAN